MSIKRRRFNIILMSILSLGLLGLFWLAYRAGWISPKADTVAERLVEFGPGQLKDGTLDNVQYSDSKAALYLAPE